MNEAWTYVYDVKHFDKDDYTLIQKKHGILWAESLAEASRQVCEYYGDDAILELNIQAIDLGSFIEIDDENIGALTDILEGCYKYLDSVEEKKD